MPTPSQLRDQLQEKVILELLGPAGGKRKSTPKSPSPEDNGQMRLL